jgi:hypothetical protein
MLYSRAPSLDLLQCNNMLTSLSPAENATHTTCLLPVVLKISMCLFPPWKTKAYIPTFWRKFQPWLQIDFVPKMIFILDLTIPEFVDCFVNTLGVHKRVISDLLNLFPHQKEY